MSKDENIQEEYVVKFKKRRKIKEILAIASMIMLITSCSNKSNISKTNTGMEQSTSEINTESSIELEIIEKENNIEYLKNNMTVVDVNNLEDFSDLGMLKGELEDKEVFLTGEVHGVQGNKELEMKFLKFFKELGNVEYYLCEMQYSDTYYLNKYLETGNEKILKKLYGAMSKDAQGYNKDDYNYWKNVYAYNKTLSNEDKIRLVGIDIVHNEGTALEYLEDIILEKGINNNLLLGKIFEKSINYNDIYVNFDEVLDEFHIKEDEYREWLQEEFIGVKHTVSNLVYGSKAYAAGDNYNNVRDEYMWKNFKEIYEELPKGKYFGQWGWGHIFQQEAFGSKWLATFMNSDESPVKGRVLSILYGYENCNAVGMKDQKFNVFIDNPKGIRDMDNENYTMFKLDGEELVFEGKKVHQYLVVIKDAEASERLDEEIR